VAHNPYVEAARALGCGHLRILVRYVLPNVAATIIILATIGLGLAGSFVGATGSWIQGVAMGWLALELGNSAFVLGLVGFALLSRRVVAFWARVRQGLTILFDRRRYLREVWLVQFAGWLFRFAAFWNLLEAFGIGGSVRNVLLVLGVNAVASIVPFTPGGAGVQQAFLVKVFAGAASGATVAAYSVGQQIAIATFSLALGFVALVAIFHFTSFRAVIEAGREARQAEAATS